MQMVGSVGVGFCALSLCWLQTRFRRAQGWRTGVGGTISALLLSKRPGIVVEPLVNCRFGNLKVNLTGVLGFG